MGALTPSATSGPRPRAGRRRLLAPESGQAVVELALVLPLIVILLLGLVDFGRAFNYQSDLSNLVNQAARYASVNSCAACNGESIDAYVESTADSPELEYGTSNGIGIAPPGVQISFCFPSGSTGAVGEPLEVKATATYRWLPGLISFLGIPDTSTLSASDVVRIEEAYVSPPSATSDAYGQTSTPPSC